MSKNSRIVPTEATPTGPQKGNRRLFLKAVMILAGVVAYLIAEGGAYIKDELGKLDPWPAPGTYVTTFEGKQATLEILSTAGDGALLTIDEDKFSLTMLSYDHRRREWKVEVICRDTMGTRSGSATMKFVGINENAILLYSGLAEAPRELKFKRPSPASNEQHEHHSGVPKRSDPGL